MDFELNDDQAGILTGLDQLIASLKLATPHDPLFCAYASDLDLALAESGFLDVAREEGFGALEGALIVERLARLPQVVEAAATVLVGPALGIAAGIHPIALADGRYDKPTRFLPKAQLLLVDQGHDVLVVSVDPSAVENVETLFAYPYGRLTRRDGLETRSLGRQATTILRRRQRIALAVEAAGLMQAALDTVLEHVKSRRAFGRPLGSFQAIQHRLAMAAESTQSSKWLSFRAAWSDEETDAAVAAVFVQERIPAFTYDLHQFCGAMGLTLEFPLHHWTYRLRALLGELGGSTAQARAAALAAWPDKA